MGNICCSAAAKYQNRKGEYEFMYCKKCGSEIKEGEVQCPNCGTEIQCRNENCGAELVKGDNLDENHLESKYKLSAWCCGAIVSLICGCFTFYKGIDKMVNYDSGDYYPYKAANAYVGGDAYNYIINGTYATAFFVLTAMFVMAALGLMMIHYISRGKR